MIMRSLTRGRGVWRRYPSIYEVTTFMMKALNQISKVWYTFICANLKPSLHLFIVTRDKTILLYAIIQGSKFDVVHVIERGIIESTQGRCTGALIHPSLITQLCHLAEVPMLESEEKSHHRLPLSFPKSKDGALDKMEDDEEGEHLAVGEQAEEDSDDEEDIYDLLVAL